MNNNQSVNEAMDLLFNPVSLQEAIKIEDEIDCDVTAGLDWGLAIPAMLSNPALFDRLTQLRVSLNREIFLFLKAWNLGIGEKAAFEVAHQRLMQRLQIPELSALSVLEDVLMRDELYNSGEFIADREMIKSLLDVLLLESDWQEIALAAGNSVQRQVLSQVSFNHFVAAKD